MKRSGTACSILVAWLLVCAGHTSYATYTSGAGSACEPQNDDPGDVDHRNPIYHLVNGAQNPSTTKDAIFMCPLAFGTQSASSVSRTNVVLEYKDLTDSAYFWCQVYQGYQGGTVSYSILKYTYSLAGGSVDPTTAFVGAQNIQWNSTELGSNNVQYVTANYGVLCNVPRDTGGGASWVTTLYAY
ncbi:MAG TPA: hypothetical protein VIF57_03835 [Polyangia bacterium]|jgi:hypothetical protein